MNAMTCEEVEGQLDLLAAGECDAPSKEAIEQHLGACPKCAASFAESQRLHGLLDLHYNDQGLERLRRRIDEHARPSRKKRLFTPFLRRAVAVAALFLIAVGLLLWSPIFDREKKASEPAFALLVHARKEIRAPGSDKPPALLKDRVAEAVAVIPLAARGGAAFRHELEQAQRDGKLPAPPAVFLELALVNTGKRAVEVRLGDAPPTLTLDLEGAGIVRIPAPGAEEPEFLRPQTFRLEPGERHVFQIDRLIAGSRGKLEYIYLTEPGETTLTAHLRLTTDGNVVTVTAPPVRIKVGK